MCRSNRSINTVEEKETEKKDKRIKPGREEGDPAENFLKTFSQDDDYCPVLI